MDRIRILLIDDDEYISSSIAKAIQSTSDFELVGNAPNGEEGIELVKKLKPDIILLDIIMPVKDGFSVLEAINNMQTDGYKAKTIVLSSMVNHYEISKSSSLGAVHFIAKPFDMDSLISSIKDLSSYEQSFYSAGSGQYINEVLSSLNLPENLKGYKYIKEILLEKANNPNKVYLLSKDLYSMVSEKYNDTVYSIERSIRTIIHKGWSNKKFGNCKIFEGYTKCPSNSQFLAKIAEILNLNS